MVDRRQLGSPNCRLGFLTINPRKLNMGNSNTHGNCSSLPVKHILAGILITLVCILTTVEARSKTDVIILKNGDRITGEIKKLERGRLSLKTDSMYTVSIAWKDIEQITSQYYFEVETTVGNKYFGSVATLADERKIQIAGAYTAPVKEHMEIVTITPVEETFFERWNGWVDVGFALTKANSFTQWTLGSEFTYRPEMYEVRARIDSLFNSQEAAENTSRHTAGLSYLRFRGRKWYVTGLGNFTHNREMNIKLRSVVGGGVGNLLRHTNNSQISLTGALSYNREVFLSDEPISNSAEGIIAVRTEFFRYRDPEMDFTTNFSLIPSVTQAGRVRMDLDTKLRYELFKDFYWSITFWDSYDSRPRDESITPRNDYGLTTALGWKF